MQTIMNFIIGNISYILLAVAIIYFIVFIVGIIRSRKTGQGFSFSLKLFIPFLIILIFAVYCLVTGKDFTQYIMPTEQPKIPHHNRKKQDNMV